MKVLLCTRGDGSVAVERFIRDDGSYSSGVRARIASGMTEEQALADLIATRVKAAGYSMAIIGDSSELPSGNADGTYDKTFVAALERDSGKVVVNMPKARDIHREVLRGKRAPVLAALDVEFMRAVETGDTKKQEEIAAQKQALRDVTADPAIESARTPDELKAVVPDVLKEGN